MLTLKNKTLSVSRWDFYSWVIILISVLFQIAQWNRLPMFIDCYYHLSVVQGFADAGGWVGKAFWEYAPVGRPHLYPPLFHMLELLLYKAGLSLITAAKIAEFLIYPIFLAGVWHVLRKLLSGSFAFFSLFLIVSSFPLYLNITNNIPFSLSFIFGLLFYYFFAKNKLIFSCIFLALAFYTHSTMPWFLVFAAFIYCLLMRGGFKKYFMVVLGAIFAALPLFLHQLRFVLFVQSVRPADFYYSEINIFLYILALSGIVFAFFRKDKFYFFVALALGIVPMFFTNRYRYLSGQGVVPLCFLGALALDSIYAKISAKPKAWQRACFWLGIGLLLQAFSLWVTASPFDNVRSAGVGNSLLRHIAGLDSSDVTSKEICVYHPKEVGELVDIIKRNTSPSDIVYSNYYYVGGMVALLSHRATSTAMLSEIKPFYEFDEIKAARLILWFKVSSGEFPDDLRKAISEYQLKRMGETEVAYLYLNENPEVKNINKKVDKDLMV